MFSAFSMKFRNSLQVSYPRGQPETLWMTAYIRAEASCRPETTQAPKTQRPFLTLSPSQELDYYEFGTIEFVVSQVRQLKWRKFPLIVQILESSKELKLGPVCLFLHNLYSWSRTTSVSFPVRSWAGDLPSLSLSHLRPQQQWNCLRVVLWEPRRI